MKGGEDTFGLMSSTYNSIAVITSMGLRFVGVDPETHTFNVSTDQILSNNAVSHSTKPSSFMLSKERMSEATRLRVKRSRRAERCSWAKFSTFSKNERQRKPQRNCSSRTALSGQENPEYKFYVNTKSSYYGVSKNACGGDKDMISDFLNVFVYHSNKIVYPAFRQTFGSVYCQDERAMEMLDYIINGRQYDLSYHKGTSAMGQVQDFIHQGKNTLNRAANSFVKTLRSMVDTFVDDMTASE
jgi:hypothetical protein